MNIVVAVRCYNEEINIPRFIKGYDFADTIVVSDGGSRDRSVEMLMSYPNVSLHYFDGGETRDGHFWNTDNPHINHVINIAKTFNPDWLILDDMDDVPNYILRENARQILESSPRPQVNAFRLYMWNEDQHFPYMNREFNPAYRSLWAWRPGEIDIHADERVRHGTMVGLIPDPFGIDIPMCLLHKSWDSKTIEKKLEHYRKVGLPMNHPLDFAGNPTKLPEWAHE